MPAPPAFLHNPMFNAVFVLGFVQLIKKINLEDPTNLMYARISYVTAQVLVITLTYLLIYLVRKKNGTYWLESGDGCEYEGMGRTDERIRGGLNGVDKGLRPDPTQICRAPQDGLHWRWRAGEHHPH
ncbi:hypothetical protein BC936DRAFT_147276 [Jimgerdemannia flammicorona]|uniref:Uncharacterized protein n=1 Tax=Jimgerdemannia flammicorona TaxID=994334 RepID=A0A433D5P7_9FUNG|nr:hypothetical protein BC936DRAFT_147276 [Jimgerdemannia flammicorona]